ncbi:EpsI family protein [Marinobacter maroccanus]|uniref:EpsI family protein n=1 Tax=Marinobacter maroccanus TaxID=2055143 RepID=A0A2S5ZBN6_9GAMM|nr:exosortase A [Marinobacter maroccanus]PPI84708.1 EpsI family protein [Marinobacter maroccanus]
MKAATSRGGFIHLVSLLFFAIIFFPEWADYFELWDTSIVYAHGFLVFAAILFLLIQNRDEIIALPLNPSLIALLGLFALCAIMLVAKAADIKTIRLLAVPFIIACWGWAIWGFDYLRKAGVPVLLLVFAAPIWDDMSPLFQAITVFFNRFLLEIVNIPAEIQEFYITIPGGTFFVAGGCSGVRYLMVALFLAPFYGYLYYKNFSRSLILTLIAGFLSMFANWIRVFGIIVAGHVTDMESSLIEDHELFGWITFIILCLVPLFFIARALEPKAALDSSLNGIPRSGKVSRTNNVGMTFPALATAFVLAVPVIFYSQTVLFEAENPDWTPAVPVSNEQWRGPLRFAEVWQPSFVNADVSEDLMFVSEDLQRVQFSLVGYRSQAQNKELVYYRNRLFDDGWQQLSSNRRALEPTNVFNVDEVTETMLLNESTGRTVLVWSWYEVGDFASPSRLQIKLVGGLLALTGDSKGAFLALAGQCDGLTLDSCGEQREAFEAFISAVERS